jgi:hypothetical protein
MAWNSYTSLTGRSCTSRSPHRQQCLAELAASANQYAGASGITNKPCSKLPVESTSKVRRSLSHPSMRLVLTRYSHQPLPSTYGPHVSTSHGAYTSHNLLGSRIKPATLPVPPTVSHLYRASVPSTHRTTYADYTGQRKPQHTPETARHAPHRSKYVERPASTRYDVNTDSRTRLTQVGSSTVRISGLPHEYKKSQLVELLKRYGEVEVSSCRPEGRAPTTTAVASFTSSAAATRAIRNLDGSKFHDQILDAQLTVRPDSTVVRRSPSTKSKPSSGNRTSAAVKGPLVVNGAMNIRPRYHRKGRRSPSDSDSDDGDSDDDSDGSRTTSGRTSRRPSCY